MRATISLAAGTLEVLQLRGQLVVGLLGQPDGALLLGLLGHGCTPAWCLGSVGRARTDGGSRRSRWVRPDGFRCLKRGRRGTTRPASLTGKRRWAKSKPAVRRPQRGRSWPGAVQPSVSTEVARRSVRIVCTWRRPLLGSGVKVELADGRCGPRRTPAACRTPSRRRAVEADHEHRGHGVVVVDRERLELRGHLRRRVLVDAPGEPGQEHDDASTTRRCTSARRRQGAGAPYRSARVSCPLTASA